MNNQTLQIKNVHGLNNGIIIKPLSKTKVIVVKTNKIRIVVINKHPNGIRAFMDINSITRIKDKIIIHLVKEFHPEDRDNVRFINNKTIIIHNFMGKVFIILGQTFQMNHNIIVVNKIKYLKRNFFKR